MPGQWPSLQGEGRVAAHPDSPEVTTTKSAVEHLSQVVDCIGRVAQVWRARETDGAPYLPDLADVGGGYRTTTARHTIGRVTTTRSPEDSSPEIQRQGSPSIRRRCTSISMPVVTR